MTQRPAGIRELDIRTALDYLCEVGREQEVFFLWRLTLRDPDDDMVLELAVAAGCVAVVTYLRDRAKRGSRAAFDAVLAKVPDVEPPDYDRLPHPRLQPAKARRRVVKKR